MKTGRARVPAYAKLNLGLRVLYKRPDGYHELRTIFQTISVADRLDIDFKPARTTRIAVNGTPEIPDNLVERACRRVLELLKIHADVAFDLKKNIPLGAGLGGGSSDAAAVLLAIPALAGKYLPLEQLTGIAGELGSDVPFFLHGGAALGLGRGEELYPLPDSRGVHGLLIVPKVHSSTAEAYRDLSVTLTSIALQNKLVTFQQEVWQGAANGIAAGFESCENDFETVVFARHPELKRIKQRLLRFGAKPAAMTGSGSGIFGIFPDAASVNRVQSSFADERVFRFSFLSRAQYYSAWRRALHLHAEGTLWPPRNLSVRSQYAR